MAWQKASEDLAFCSATVEVKLIALPIKHAAQATNSLKHVSAWTGGKDSKDFPVARVTDQHDACCAIAVRESRECLFTFYAVVRSPSDLLCKRCASLGIQPRTFEIWCR